MENDVNPSEDTTATPDDVPESPQPNSARDDLAEAQAQDDLAEAQAQVEEGQRI